VLLGTAVLASIWNLGIREVHRADDPVNFAVLNAHPRPGDWPWWGGVHQNQIDDLSAPPVEVSGTRPPGWSLPLSGVGRLGLCNWGDRLFLPVADTARQTVSILCLNRISGERLWQTDLHPEGLMASLDRRSQTSTTPACDGERVYLASAVQGGLWVTALDLNGRIVWQREAGPYQSRWGYGSSPTFYKSLVIVAADNKGSRLTRLGGASYIAALHRHTGELIWRVRRTDGDSFGTPIVSTVAGRDQLVMAGRSGITSYDPATGERLWTFQWPAERVANAVATDGLHVFCSTRQPHADLVCIRADGTGDVTRTHLVWRTSKTAGELPTPIVYDGKVYSVSDDGVVTCLDASTGQPVWKRRLRGTIASTPLIAGANLYCASDEGTVFVIRLGARGDLIAEIPIGEAISTSPVVIQNSLFIRTHHRLQCLMPTGESAPLAVRPDGKRRDL